LSVKRSLFSLLRGGLKTALPLLALFVGITSYKTLKSNQPKPPKPVIRETVQPVRTQEITLASHQPGLRLYGEIISGRKVELRALVAGKVQKTGDHFREGALVKKGDLLLSIDPFAYKGAVVDASAKIVEAQARLKEIKAQIKAEEDSIIYAREQLKLSRRDLERANKLVRKGSVTAQGAEQRELVVSQRRQTVEGKLANLAILRAKAEQQVAGLDSLQWQLQRAKRNRRDTELKAPFSGYIADVNADMGKLLNVNDKVALLLDNSWMDVVFTLSDRQYGRLLEGQGGLIGQAVKVTWKLGDTPLQYKAIIERVAAQISSETGGVSVYARLEDPSSPRSIRTGAFVDVNVPDRVYNNVVRLPQTALYQRQKVYVVGPKNRLEERIVKLQAIDGEFVLVSGELATGENVVITRMSTIGVGMKVQDLKSASDPVKKPSKSRSLSEAEKTIQENGWKPTRGTPTGSQKEKLRQKGQRSLNVRERQNRG
jgi:membrane fusion protein, multidrug efflux system